MIFNYISIIIQRLLSYERSPGKLAFTCALGIYIGISPFIGFHTIMTFLFGWFFALSIPALLAISIAINNPWTMIPVYSLDHYFGKWLLHSLEIDYAYLEPTWVESCTLFIKENTGISGLSLSAFLIGGNVLGISIAIIMYPLIKKFFTLYVSKKLMVNQTPNV